IDATQERMEHNISEFGRQLYQGGVGLFYYAGHGVQVDGENYLIPVGANIQSESDVRYKAVNIGQVLGKMGEARNGLNIVILDACRDNPFAKRFRSASRGLAIVSSSAVKGTFIAYATSPGKVASDGEDRNGLYTKQLL
ncbi:MAG: caspase family protein, partial [Nitrospira sp.]|nr:caspase family protein [Nitrospira sp.]